MTFWRDMAFLPTDLLFSDIEDVQNGTVRLDSTNSKFKLRVPKFGYFLVLLTFIMFIDVHDFTQYWLSVPIASMDNQLNVCSTWHPFSLNLVCTCTIAKHWLPIYLAVMCTTYYPLHPASSSYFYVCTDGHLIVNLYLLPHALYIVTPLQITLCVCTGKALL